MTTHGKIVAALACAVLLTASGCGKAQEKPEAKPVRPVRTVEVPAPSNGRVHTYSGVAKAAIETNLSFRVPGEIVFLETKIGRKVKKGQVIARLDPTDYGIKVGQLEAELARVDAGLRQASNEYGRARRLYEVGNATKAELDQAQAQYESNKALRLATQRSLQWARQQLSYCTLRAPLDASIASRPVEIHQTVAAGQPVAILASRGHMEMVVGVPETVIGKVAVDDTAKVTFDSLPGRVYEGHLTEVGVELQPSNTYPIKVGLDEAGPEVKTGMVGEAALTFKDPGDSGALLVPPEAVAGAPDGSRYVWVVEPTGKLVSRRTVQTGKLTSDGLEVLGGLKPGEILVIRGVHSLTDGQQVRLMQAPK